MKKNIAVLTGGFSAEYQVSIWSSENVMANIDTARYNPYLVFIKEDGWTALVDGTHYEINRHDFSFEMNAQKISFHFAFFAIHGTPAEDGLLQGYFDLLNIPHSASSVLSSSLSFHKYAYNHFIKTFDIVNIAQSVLVKKGETLDTQAILSVTGLPCFVKPNEQGSSFGIAKVTEASQLAAAIEQALENDDHVIIEEFLEGTEVTNGMVKTSREELVFPITEIVSKNELFDFKAKYDPNFAEEITPARISDELTKRIQDTTAQIYKVSGFNGIVRIDYIIKGEDIYMLEANTIPGMTFNSFIPKQLACMGKSIQEVLTMIID